MQFNAGIAIGCILGAAVSIVAISTFDIDSATVWLSPTVIGPAAGSFFAALIGLGSALWVHHEDKQSRKLSEHQKTIHATNKLFAATLELVASQEMYIRELEKIRDHGQGRPNLMAAVHSNTLQICKEIAVLSLAEQLHAIVATHARSTVRAFNIEKPIVGFQSELINEMDPLQLIPVNESDRKVISATIEILRQQLGSVVNNIRLWNDWYLLTDRLDDFDSVMENAIKTTEKMFMPLHNIRLDRS